MALSFLKDRDENAVVGNLGAFTGGGARGNSIQVRWMYVRTWMAYK